MSKLTIAFKISNKIIPIFLAMVTTLPDLSTAQTKPYAAYNIIPQGASTRVIGMGGASTALINDATSFLFNPAGPASAKWRFDGGGATNRLDNNEDFVSSKPYDVQFYSAAARLGKKLVFGVGLSSPYNYTLNTFTTTNAETELNVLSYDAGVSLQITKNLSLGATGHYVTYEEKLTEGSAVAEEEVSLIYPSLGILYRNDKTGIGLVYHGAQKADFDETKDDSFGTVWFRDLEVAARWSIGFFLQMTKDVKIALDFDQFLPTESDMIAVGTGNFGDSSAISVITDSINVFHGGLEYKVLDSKSSSVFLHIGGYNEPARVLGFESRLHITLGTEIRFGPLVLGIAYDQAKNFTNTSGSFSLALGSL